MSAEKKDKFVPNDYEKWKFDREQQIKRCEQAREGKYPAHQPKQKDSQDESK